MVVVNPLLILSLALPVLGVFVFAMRYDPARLSARLTERLASGMVLVGLWNLFLPAQHIAFNPITIALSGWLGLPGAALTLLMGLI